VSVRQQRARYHSDLDRTGRPVQAGRVRVHVAGLVGGALALEMRRVSKSGEIDDDEDVQLALLAIAESLEAGRRRSEKRLAELASC
jgi:hypothetical protein